MRRKRYVQHLSGCTVMLDIKMTQKNSHNRETMQCLAMRVDTKAVSFKRKVSVDLKAHVADQHLLVVKWSRIISFPDCSERKKC